jgi:hypothetical protein
MKEKKPPAGFNEKLSPADSQKNEREAEMKKLLIASLVLNALLVVALFFAVYQLGRSQRHSDWSEPSAADQKRWEQNAGKMEKRK